MTAESLRPTTPTSDTLPTNTRAECPSPSPITRSPLGSVFYALLALAANGAIFAALTFPPHAAAEPSASGAAPTPDRAFREAAVRPEPSSPQVAQATPPSAAKPPSHKKTLRKVLPVRHFGGY